MWSSTTSSHQNQQKIHEKVYKNEHQVRVPPCELKREEYEPKKSFYEMHQQTKRWTNWESQRIVTAPGHCATVDSVLLFEKNDNKFCLSESRDRVIRFWDVDNVERGVDSVANPWTVAQDDMAQLEWSWNMARDSNTDRFYSTSWDSTVKSWAITDNGAIQNLNTVNVGSAVQAVSCSGNENEIVCTTFAKRTAVIDSRTFGIVAEHSLHKRAVIGLAVKENKIFTCGEDRLMMMVDRRNMSRPVLFEYCQDAYKSSLSLQRNQLLTSTSDGKVKLYDATNFHDFQTYSVGAFTRQSLLQHGAHFVMARCKRGYYKFLMNSPGIRSPKRCSSHQLTAKPAKFDYSSEMKTLTIGNSMDRSERRSMISEDLDEKFEVEVDTCPHLPTNFETMKWQERRRSLESFLQTLTGKKCILSNISYDASIKKLQKIIRNDANIFGQVLAIRSVKWVATELGAEFSKFSVSLLPDLLEKMKEKKQILRKPLIRCTLEVGKTLPLEDGIPVILSALSMANPEIKKQTMLFVVQQLEAMQMERLKGFIPSLLPVLVELTKNATQDVREVAVHALESIYWKIGRCRMQSLLSKCRHLLPKRHPWHWIKKGSDEKKKTEKPPSSFFHEAIGSIIYSGEELHAARFSRSNCIRVDLEDQFIRPNLLVGLLKILETHAADTTSLNLYECSDVLVRDDTEKNGAREERRLAAAILNESADFAAIVNCLIKLLDALKLSPTKDGDNFHLEISDNQTFSPGHYARMVGPNDVFLGHVGVVHPEVLRKFNLMLPVAAFEIKIFTEDD